MHGDRVEDPYSQRDLAGDPRSRCHQNGGGAPEQVVRDPDLIKAHLFCERRHMNEALGRQVVVEPNTELQSRPLVDSVA